MRPFYALRAVILVAVLLALGPALGLTTAAAAAAGDPPAVPAPIAVPPGSVLLFSYKARGVQIYKCRSGQWAFHAPRALLFEPESHRPVGTHYGGIDRELTPGPWWESASDGSRIRGSVLASAPSPNADSIPQLLLTVQERQGAGVLSPVSHIQRLNTRGGVGPSGACQTGARRQVPYTTDYYFYAAP
jgi:hypothetical protein